MNKILLKSISLAFIFGCFSSWSQTYVNVNATGSNDGSSWTNAYTDLQQAIFDAQSGDEIWVSQGTYIPSIDEAGILPASLRLRYFWLKDGVQVYGGFNGTEVEFNQRDLNSQKAVLDGQVDASNKAYHVLNVSASNTAKLDGFIVRNGDAGIGSSEGVSNSGGGLYLSGDAQFFNIEFENNIGYHHGGAVFAVGSSSTFVNCRFDGNSTTLYDGAALYAQTSANITLYNCVLYNNTATRFGGAIALAGSSTITLQNASIANNTGVNVYQASTSSTINHNQSILWGNTSAIGIDTGGGSSVNFTECVYQWTATGSNINADPLFVNIATGDLHLSAASPAIDAVATSPYNPYRDIDGNYRIAGAALDMGAYEYGSIQGLIIFVDKDATGANNGSSWGDAFTTLQAALANATFTQGEEIWIADGTYNPHASDRSAHWALPNGMKLYGGFNATETLRSQRNAALNIVRLSGDLNGDDNANIDYSEATRQDNSYHLLYIQSPKSDIVVDGVTIADGNANGTGNELTAPALITFHTGADQLIQIDFNDVIVEKNTAINAGIYQNFHYATQGGTTVVNFSHSVIRNNSSASVLGNMLYVGDRGYNQKNYGKIDNCLFYDNVCTSTFGVATIYNVVNNGFGVVCPMEVTNNTFTENAGASGYAMGIGRSADSRYINNIFYNNGSATPILWVNSGIPLDVFQNCISEDVLFGLNQDPLFRNAVNDDFRIDCSGLSPAIDGGTSFGVMIEETDFAGLPRVSNSVDIGAHEFQAGIQIAVTATTLCPGESVTLTASNGTGISWNLSVVDGTPFTPTNTATYTATGTTANNCTESESILVEVVSIADFSVTATPTSLCSSGSATVDIAGSSTENSYTLVNNATSAVLDGPTAGTGAGLSFNTGVLSSTTTVNVTASKLVTTNRAFDFDGVNDYVFLGASDRSVGSTITVSTRVKANATGAAQWIAVKYSGSIGYILYIDAAGKAKLDGRDGAGGYKSSGASTTTVTDGQWHEITGVVSSTGWYIYVDGILENSGAYTPGGSGLASGTNLTSGAYAGQFTPFDIDQLTIWNTALDATGVQNILTTCFTGQESNVVAHFDFEETSGTTITDYSPSAVDGIIYGLDPALQSIEGSINGCSQFCEKIMDQPITITIADNQAPVPGVASLSDVSAQCSVSSLTAPLATDNCAGSVTGTTSASFPITSSTTVTWTYDDGNGNTSTQLQNVIINDNVAPVADVASLNDLTAQCSITSLTAPSATDNCLGSVTGSHNATLPILASTTITWTYDDGNGNTSTQTQNVVINDITAPVANTPTLSDLNAQCSITSLTAPSATDNCVGSVTGSHNATLPISASTTITWTYDDGNGNTSTQTQNVVINDNTAPVPTTGTLSPITAQCEVTALTSPTANDNCTGVVSGTHNATLPITTNTSITWTYDDGNGNTSTQTQVVTLNDVTAPVQDQASLSDLTAQCEITSLTAPTASDNCVGAVTGTHNATLPITSTSTITWTYDDGNGNTSTQTQNVIVNDNTSPVADLATLTDVNAQCSVTSLNAPTATDNCIGSLTGTHNATLPITSNTTVTWTYNDGNGNVSTQTQNVVINDNTPPVPDLATLPDVVEQCSVTSLSNPSATDNCSAVLVSNNAVLPITSNTTITWTYADAEGNSSTQTQNVVLNDITAPLPDIASLADLTAQCEITSLTAPTATDNCIGTVTGIHNVTLPITASTTITWTFDDGNGNTLMQTQNVVINDNTAPVADLATLADLTAACEITSLIAPTATDNCSGTITATHNATLPISSTMTITWIYDDGNGNTSTQSQNVIINDNVAPVADATSLSDINEQCEVTSLVAPTATDNCQGSITGVPDATLPITTSILITWTFDDGNGNTSTQTQQVNISDITAPVADQASLSDITETCEVSSLTPPTATDNCVGTLTGTSNVTLPITSTATVTWTYDDGNGNTSTQNQLVTIVPVNAGISVSGITLTADEGSADNYQWVDCNNGNTAIAGETNQSFTPSANGSYAIEVTIGNCTETSACEAITTIGLDENTMISLTIYPNPTFGKLNITTDSEVQKVSIFDVTGSLVQQEELSSFSVETLAPGTYTLSIQTNLGIAQKRFVKE
jgi:hypothetical protein